MLKYSIILYHITIGLLHVRQWCFLSFYIFFCSHKALILSKVHPKTYVFFVKPWNIVSQSENKDISGIHSITSEEARCRLLECSVEVIKLELSFLVPKACLLYYSGCWAITVGWPLTRVFQVCRLQQSSLWSKSILIHSKRFLT